MTSYAAKFLAKKVMGETAKNHFGKKDPYFESVPATRLDGRPSKRMKKQRKALPPGISENDARVLTKVRRRAYKLDMSLFNFLGIRFGWSSVIALIPELGDVVDAFMAVMVLRTCDKVDGGLPNTIRSKMVLNIVLDFLVGLVPFIGDLADAMYKCNTRNAILLEEHLRQKGVRLLQAQGAHSPAIDPSLGEEYDRLSDEEIGPPPTYQTATPSQAQTIVAEPPRSHQKPKSGGWFTSGSRQTQPDVERGEGFNAGAGPTRGSSRKH